MLSLRLPQSRDWSRLQHPAEHAGKILAAIFIFCTLSALHLESRLLTDGNFEMLIVGALALLYVPLWIFQEQTEEPSKLSLWLGIASVLAVAPLLSSLSNHTDMRVLLNGEYRSWLKALLVFAFLPWLARREGGSRWMVDAVLAGVVVFCLIVQYRFHWLGEMRVFDDRPKLLIKNGDPNFICVLTATALPFALYRWQTANAGARAAWILVLGLLGYTVLITESRMGIVSVAVGLGALAWATPQGSRWRRLSWGFLMLFLLGITLLGDSLARFGSLADASNHERWRSILTGFTLAWEKPFFGFGWGESAGHFYRVTEHDRLISEADALAVHNTPLQLWAELGLFGLFGFAWIWRECFIAARRALANRSPLGSAAYSAFIILSLNLLTLPLKGKDFVILYFALILACAEAAVRERGK